MHEAALGGLALDQLLFLFRVACGFGFEALILDHMLGCHRDDIAVVVEAFAACASTDLVEVAGGEDAGFDAAIFTELGEEHGADRHVDADAEGIGAANHFEHAFLSELLDQHSILGQQTRVV